MNSNWKENFPKTNRYFETGNGILYYGDAEEILKKFPSESIHLTITSPPYNVNLGQNKFKKDGYDIYNDDKKHEDYITWLTDIFNNIKNKTKKGGRLVINIADRKNGKIPTHCDITKQLIKNNWLLHSQIIWDKKQIGNRLAWGSFCSPSNPSYPTQFEHILIFSKEQYKLGWKGKTDLTPEEFKKFAIALWSFPPETRMKKYEHPAMFPEELPYRVIKMNSYITDIVFDCFAGAGTTLITAEKLKRRWIGIEISKKYCEITKQRFEKEVFSK